jgi:hypothetical protein
MITMRRIMMENPRTSFAPILRFVTHLISTALLSQEIWGGLALSRANLFSFFIKFFNTDSDGDGTDDLVAVFNRNRDLD